MLGDGQLVIRTLGNPFVRLLCGIDILAADIVFKEKIVVFNDVSSIKDSFLGNINLLNSIVYM